MDKTNNETMKPLTLVVDDFKQNLINQVYQSHLPFFIVRTVLEDLLNEAKRLEIEQLNRDRENYNQSLKQGGTDECE